MMGDSGLLSKQAYAAAMSVSPKTVDVWRKTGRLELGRDYILGPAKRPRFYPIAKPVAERTLLERIEHGIQVLITAIAGVGDDLEFVTEVVRELSRRSEEDRKHVWICEPLVEVIDRGLYPDKARLTKYGITQEQYSALLESQRGLCGICGKPPSGLLFIDHDHESGHVRGLLCPPCNTGIGLLGDTSIMLQRATDYLNDPPMRYVIPKGTVE